MLSTKSIFETLAALGAGAILMTGCGSAQTPVNSQEVPAAQTTEPAAPEPAPAEAAAPAESQSGDATAGAAEKAPDAAPAATPAPAAAAPAATPAKPKPGATTKTGAKKKDAAAACGQGTCG